MPIAPGARLGGYEVLSPLGAGGMGEVYRARDSRLARDVAIKILPEALAGDAAARARFEREAHAIAALSHPNILGIYNFGVGARAAARRRSSRADGERARGRMESQRARSGYRAACRRSRSTRISDREDVVLDQRLHQRFAILACRGRDRIFRSSCFQRQPRIRVNHRAVR